MPEVIRCEHPGCNREDTIACVSSLSVAVDEEPEFLCPNHAAQSGYCGCCGCFCAGMESFDFLHPGWCDTCWEEVHEEDDEYEFDWEWEDDDWDDDWEDDLCSDESA